MIRLGARIRRLRLRWPQYGRKGQDFNSCRASVPTLKMLLGSIFTGTPTRRGISASRRTLGAPDKPIIASPNGAPKGLQVSCATPRACGWI